MKEQPNTLYIENLAKGNEEFRARFIGILKSEFPVEKANYLSLMQRMQYEEAWQEVHKIKHKFSILGLVEGHELASTHEESLRDGDPRYHEQFSEVLDGVGTYIQTL